MSQHIKGITAGFLGAFLATIILVAGFYTGRYFLTPIPYRDVFIVEQWPEGDGWLHVTATFIKTDCEFNKLAAIGHNFGETFALSWRDREVPAGDRLRGVQALRINIADYSTVDSIELRTRHICDGRPVDRTFAWLDPREVIMPDDPPKAGQGGPIPPTNPVFAK